MVSAGILSACGKSVDGSEPTGDVTVTITGLGSGLTDGGTALITRTDVTGFTPVQITLPVSGTGTVTVPVGTYHAVYTPPVGYQVNGPNTFDVTIVQGQNPPLTVTVAAIATSGTLRVIVTGLAGATAGGGTASAVRTDISGQSPISIPVPAAGVIDAVVPTGTYQVTYTAPAGFSLGSGVTNPQTTTVTAAATTAVSFDVTGSGTGGGFQPPNIKNNASFETDFDGFTNWSLGAPIGVTRDGTHSLVGSMAVLKALPPTTVDLGSQFVYPLVHAGSQATDRLWTRFYFFLDTNIDGGIKFTRYFDTGFNTQFSGLGIQAHGINLRLSPEWDSLAPVQFNIANIGGLIGSWHSLELDYWRNGDTSNGGNDYPSVAIWLDGNQITNNLTPLPPGAAWINGRMNAGRRTSSAKIGIFELIGLLNGAPQNTINGNIWIDQVSISTLGRIGP